MSWIELNSGKVSSDEVVNWQLLSAITCFNSWFCSNCRATIYRSFCTKTRIFFNILSIYKNIHSFRLEAAADLLVLCQIFESLREGAEKLENLHGPPYNLLGSYVNKTWLLQLNLHTFLSEVVKASLFYKYAGFLLTFSTCVVKMFLVLASIRLYQPNRALWSENHRAHLR